MTSQTNEQALESAIEKHLTGTCLEELKENGIDLGKVSESRGHNNDGNGYFIGSPDHFNVRYSIDELRFWNFLETTQKDELDKLQKYEDLENKGVLAWKK